MERLLWQYTLLNVRDRANEIDKPPVLREPTNFSTSVLSQFFCLENINLNTNCDTERISCFSLFHVSEITLPTRCACVLSRVCLCTTLWNVACWLLSMRSLSMGFSRQDYWSGLPCHPPGNLPNPGIEPVSLVSSALQADFYSLSHLGS